MLKHLNIKVSGKVQGVFFRAQAKAKAEQLGILGFAKNEDDGSVYIETEGESNNLDKFLGWCKEGPSSAVVEKVEVNEGRIKNFSDFSIF